jgi:hypothetical protein
MELFDSFEDQLPSSSGESWNNWNNILKTEDNNNTDSDNDTFQFFIETKPLPQFDKYPKQIRKALFAAYTTSFNEIAKVQ